MESFRPDPSVADRVLSIERIVSDGHSSRVLPSAGSVLGIQVSGRIVGPEGPLSSVGVTGLPEGTRRFSYEGPTETFLVRFRPQGVACLGVPADQLRGRSTSLDSLGGLSLRNRASELAARLQEVEGTRERVGLVEAFLRELPFRRDPRVEGALHLLDGAGASPESASIAGISRELGMSERQLERLFLERVGTTPKRYASLVRFQRAVKLLRLGNPGSTVAQSAGYADQSHFIREFRRWAGETPSRFLVDADFVP